MILSAYVQNSKPISLLLIAKAESGKSELIQNLRGYSNVLYTNDLSFKPLVENILPQVEQKAITHILIPDFINITQHKRAVENLIPLLNTLMAEGLKDLKYYGSVREYKEDLRCGIISGITREMFDKQIKFWQNVGFLTRMLVVSYGYSETTQTSIHQYIQDNFDKKKEKIIYPVKCQKNKLYKITTPKDINVHLNLMAQNHVNQNAKYVTSGRHQNWTVELKAYGFRFHKILRHLIKGICLYNGQGKRKEVNQEDLKTLISFMKYINLNFIEI